jgi:hypothetical protein
VFIFVTFDISRCISWTNTCFPCITLSDKVVVLVSVYCLPCPP